MFRAFLACIATAVALSAGVATAATPAGPRLALVKLGAKPFPLELLTVGPSGGHPLRLEGGGLRSRPVLDVFSPISWSPDGKRVAFSGIIGSRNGDDHEAIRRIFIVRADGSGLHAIRGTNGAIGPIFSPDGRTAAFTRTVERETRTTVGGKLRPEGFAGSSIWTVDLPSGVRRQLTPWRDGLAYTASSFSPDGLTLLATYEDSRLIYEPQPVALALDGSGMRRLLNDGSTPVYSPDGSEIALTRRIRGYGEDPEEDSDLYVINADGTNLRRLTHTPGRAELSPSWDPSGERLAYVRYAAARTEAAAFGVGDALMQVNADGTCQSTVASSPRAAFYTPVWQPGPGREAGRIECQRGG